MREQDQLVDLATRLLGVRSELGASAFETACHRARLAIARVVLEVADERTARGQPMAPALKINHERQK